MQKAFQTIEKYHMIQPGDRVLAGVSGGADSVCLLFTLLEYRKKVSFDIKAVHVEHGIRGEESRQDAVYVEALCQKQNVEYECVSVDIPAMAVTEKLSTEEAGRLARYQIFEEISKSWHADKIAVAHNQNDQAETILWNLARGSGLDGAAVPEQRPHRPAPGPCRHGPAEGRGRKGQKGAFRRGLGPAEPALYCRGTRRPPSSGSDAEPGPV